MSADKWDVVIGVVSFIGLIVYGVIVFIGGI